MNAVPSEAPTRRRAPGWLEVEKDLSMSLAGFAGPGCQHFCCVL